MISIGVRRVGRKCDHFASTAYAIIEAYIYIVKIVVDNGVNYISQISN